MGMLVVVVILLVIVDKVDDDDGEDQKVQSTYIHDMMNLSFIHTN